MANEEQLRILKQGVEVWNQWRKDNPEIVPNLRQANLYKVDLSMADLHGTDLLGAKLIMAGFSKANMNNADLVDADLSMADLSMADIRGAYLNAAKLIGTNLIDAGLSGANLNNANLTGADLRGANLNGAILYGTNFMTANLSKVNFKQSSMAYAFFVDVDLSTAKGLERVEHRRASTIDIDTIYKSKGKIPEKFLRGAGVPDDLITYFRSRSGKTFNYYSCFISYSHNDQDFTDRLHADLRNNGVRTWVATEDMKIGDEIVPTIDQAIRLRDKLLVVLSENSIGSNWVANEVEMALEEEKRRDEMVLFPIRLDNAVMDSKEPWAAMIRRRRHIGEFGNWKNHDDYQKAFNRLLRDLKGKD